MTQWRKKSGVEKGSADHIAQTPELPAVDAHAPIWQPDKTKGYYQLACPLCRNTHVRVYGAFIQVGGLEFGGDGNVVLNCNGHSDGSCAHRFTVTISFHDAGVMCNVTPHPVPFLPIYKP